MDLGQNFNTATIWAGRRLSYAQKFFDGHFALQAFGTIPMATRRCVCSMAGDSSLKIPNPRLFALRCVCWCRNICNKAGLISSLFSFAFIDASPQNLLQTETKTRPEKSKVLINKKIRTTR